MSGKPVRQLVVITHEDRADTRWVEEYARSRDLGVTVVQTYLGDSLPAVDDATAVVCLGGPMSAYDDLPFIHAERDYLRNAVDAERPVLGICLGSQLLASALGGAVMAGQTGPEVGYIDVRSEHAADSQWNGQLSGRFFSFHADTMEPPAQATVLARSERYVQAWELGSALAIQFHPELSVAGLEEFFDIEAEMISRIGFDTDAVMHEHRAVSEDKNKQFMELLDRWLAGEQITPTPTEGGQ